MIMMPNAPDHPAGVAIGLAPTGGRPDDGYAWCGPREGGPGTGRRGPRPAVVWTCHLAGSPTGSPRGHAGRPVTRQHEHYELCEHYCLAGTVGERRLPGGTR